MTAYPKTQDEWLHAVRDAEQDGVRTGVALVFGIIILLIVIALAGSAGAL